MYNQLRSIKECAEYMGVTQAQVRKWQEDKYLPYVKMGEGKQRNSRKSSFHDCDCCLWQMKQNKGVYTTMKGRIA